MRASLRQKIKNMGGLFNIMGMVTTFLFFYVLLRDMGTTWDHDITNVEEFIFVNERKKTINDNLYKGFTTYEAFTAQYKLLYGENRTPPRRMEEWFEYAKEHACAIDAHAEAMNDLAILKQTMDKGTDGHSNDSDTSNASRDKAPLLVHDVYQQINRDLKYFRELIWHDPKTGIYHGDPLLAKKRRKAILSEAMKVSNAMKAVHIVHLYDGKLVKGQREGHFFLPSLRNIISRLPDMTIFLGTILDEPRVLAGKPSKAVLKTLNHRADIRHVSQVRRGKNLKSLYADICPNVLLQEAIPEYAYRPPNSSLDVPSTPDAPAPRIMLDILDLDGFFLCPSTFDATYAQIPLFGPAKVNGCYRDILYPSPYYFGDLDKYTHRPPYAVQTPWETRTTKGGLYWRGTTTGTHAIDTTTHRKALRQRLVLYAKEHPDLVDAAFVGYIQYDNTKSIRDSIHAAYGPLKKRVSRMEPFHHRHILDLDGNSFSRRFLSYIQSGSLSYRAGIFTDWLLSMLRPYWHYIPLDIRFDTLAARTTYYRENDDTAKRIAMTAKAFAKRRLRREDMNCYVYRLLIEYADIFYPESDT